MSQLYGIHDREGRHIVPAGGWCVDTVALSENPAPTDYAALRGDINWIVRLNWGYGSTGTIPKPDGYAEFAKRAAAYIAASRGCTNWIIGNEPNHESERPDGQPIQPAMYADCFKRAYGEVQDKAGTRHALIPAPVALWNVSTGDWLLYQQRVWELLWQISGGIALHTYTHGASPQLITSQEKMSAPYQDRYYHFQAYRDLMALIPDRMSGLPVYITETDQNDPWVDANTGWVQEAYAEIDRWNYRPGNQQIYCLCLYRWPRFDKWHIEGKQGVIDDFRAAVANGYTSPTGNAANAPQEQIVLPHISTGSVPEIPDNSQPAPTLPPRDIDPRATQRGVSIVEIAPEAGQTMWRAVKVQWLDEQQAQGRHHIYADLLDEAGNRVVGVPLLVAWPTGNTRIVTEAKPGEPYAANFPMSPSRNEFSIAVVDGTPSEMVRGIGMGAETPGGFNAGIHTSTAITFQRVKVPAVSQPQPAQPVPQQPATVPVLAHPIADPALRIISQRFGENPADYAQFGLAGHNGLDFAVPVGTPVQAVDDGVVVEVFDDADGYGLYAKIRHVWGESLYAHLEAVMPAPMTTVTKGHVIGYSGNSGNSTGPHLHLGIRVNPYQRGGSFDGYSDPEKYLDAPKATPSDVMAAIKAAASEFGIEWQLLASLAWAESSFNPKAESSVGAMGLCQIMPAAWDEWGPKIGASAPFHAGDNARVGAAYLAWLLRQVGNKTWDALVAYGWGIGNVLSSQIPPAVWSEYANKVLHGRDLLKAVLR